MGAVSPWDGAATGVFPPGPVTLLLIGAREDARVLRSPVTDVAGSQGG